MDEHLNTSTWTCGSPTQLPGVLDARPEGEPARIAAESATPEEKFELDHRL
jgi:hypothetical protein